MTNARIAIPQDHIAGFCRRWRITEFALFGSVLRDDLRADSDIDVFIVVEDGVYRPWGGYGPMTDELEQIFGRKVDLVDKKAVEQSTNPFQKRHILSHMETIYVA